MQDEGQFLHVIPQVLSLDGRGPLRSSQEETKEAELQQPLAAHFETVQEGPVATTARNKELAGGRQRGGATTTTCRSFRTSAIEPSDINC